MKLIALALFAASAFAQATFTLPGVAGEPSLSVTVSATAVSNLTAWIASIPPTSGWPNATGQPQNTTLVSDVTGGATAIPLTSAANLATCNGIKIDNEVMAVVSVSNGTATVIRSSAGTAAAAHLANAPVTVLRSGNYTCHLKILWADGLSGVVQNKLQGAALATHTAAIATANAAIAAQVAAAVQ